MIEERQFLNFIPPKLDGVNLEEKRRYMIVAKNDFNGTIKMINISKLSGKNNKNLIKDYNVILEDHSPLRLPSFAKVNTIYTIKCFPEIEDYISLGGKKLNEKDFNNILLERERYITRTKNVNEINFTKEEFMSKNKEIISV